MKQIIFSLEEKKIFKNIINIDDDLMYEKQKKFLNKKKINNFNKDIDKYYEIIKPVLFNHFKNYHQISLDKDKIEILIGFFIRRLIIILYEKWLTIEYFKKKRNEKFYYQKLIVKYPFSNCYDDNFFFNLLKKPLWNYLVYQEIINFRKPKNFVCIKNKIKKKKILIDKYTLRNRDLFKMGINKFFLYLLKKKDFFFYCTGLTKLNEIFLNLKYNGLPIFLFPIKNRFYSNANYPERNFNFPLKKNEFINFFYKFYEKFAPSIYYEDIKKPFFYDNFDLDNKSVYTSIGHFYDLDFKRNLAWSSNYKLNILQHGADGFFLKIWTDMFKHDLKISDNYLAYTKNVSKIKKISNFKIFKKKIIHKNYENLSKIIVVLPPSKKTFTQLDTGSLGRTKTDENLIEMINFMRKKKIKFKIKFFNQNDLSAFQLKNEEIKLSFEEISNQNVKNVKNSFIVLTYFGTPVYELLNYNKPFVILENEYFKSNYNTDFNNEINLMKKNKILNFKVSEILMHLERDFTEVNKWWNQKKLLSLRSKLIQIFANGFKNRIIDIK
jgi:hypothetical protein